MKYIISVDQSTSGTKAALFDENLNKIRVLKKMHHQYYPAPGYVEHDAAEIWNNTGSLLSEIVEGIDRKDIAGLAIANQRETTVVWERDSGCPVCHAVVWQDVRSSYITEPMKNFANDVFNRTGLIPSPYYSAAKCAAVLSENPGMRERAEKGELCFGTIDAYLLFRLTEGRVFATDISNAARTQLLDIHTLQWSEPIAAAFRIPKFMLADSVLPSDAHFGEIKAIPKLEGVPVLAMMGDTNASLFGHGCIREGMVKTSYGTGSSIMMNIGGMPFASRHGLSTSVGFAYQGKIDYVLEGNITCSADTLVWLRDGLGLIQSMDELKEAESVPSTDGVYLVPAFSGLGAPWFDDRAKGVLFGMTRGTTKGHVLRAALASIAHQNADVLDAMVQDTGTPILRLQADGGGSVNTLLMQMQSDYVPCKVVVSAEKELTLTGAAKMAGMSSGLFKQDRAGLSILAEYAPKMDEQQRLAERAGWLDALRRCR
jgi:glycerol kinase